MSAPDDVALLRLAVTRGLLPPTTAQQCAQHATRVGQPATRLLVERGLLPAHVVTQLQLELDGAVTLAPTPAPPSPTAAAAAAPTYVGEAPRPTPPPTGDTTYAPYEDLPDTRPEAQGEPPAPAAGDVIGDFELLAQLGQGGMGVVFKARQCSLQREVAVKLLGAEHGGGFVERFVREARTAAAVSHPNVVTTYAAGHDERRKVMFIAMELMRGGDAERLLADAGGRLPERRALEVVRDCARGLAALEEAGLVHRDIKPENIFLAPDGTAKLGDLGLARLRSGEDRLTRTGEAVGTPCFMAPEQARGETDVDVRTDVYALGATLYRLLSGKRPFDGSAAAILYRITAEAPPDLRRLVPDVSPAVAALVERAMAKDRAERPQTARAFLTEVEAALSPAPAPAAASAAGGAPRSPIVLVLAVVALLSVAVAIAALVWARR